ncbi:hypothetical protein NC652_017849 [Populus alba x Populus x berolinensis]|nr:hypothetical protein NC652_017849 [Populus alba x Populus x berolinensis]
MINPLSSAVYVICLGVMDGTESIQTEDMDSREIALRRKKYFNLPWFRESVVSWDGYWLTESLLHDGDAFAGGLAY